MPRSALIAGASGLVGGHLLRCLLNSPDYERVIAFGRRPLGIRHARLEERLVDFAALPDFGSLPNADLFCALGTTLEKAGSKENFRRVDYAAALQYAERGAAAKAGQFLLVSSVGAHSASKNFYLRTKGELEEAVARLPFRALHIFRPSLLLGERVDHRLLENLSALLARVLAGALIGPLRKYRPMPADVLARSMLQAARADRSGRLLYEYDAIRRLVQSASTSRAHSSSPETG